jgi:hypothetical protein
VSIFSTLTSSPTTSQTSRPADVPEVSKDSAEVPGVSQAPVETTPVSKDPREWIKAELPPAYAEIADKIEALRKDAQKYEEIAGVLWQVGPPLAAGVRDIFTAMKFDASLVEHESGHSVRVSLGGDRRLIVEVAGSKETIDRKCPAFTELLRLLQNEATDQDRLVLALNAWCELPPDARKADLITADALKLAQRVGANIIPTTTLFGIWRFSLTNLEGARQTVMKLYSHDGGFFK